jgi:D-alanyl-lipoteichoic acid acyltransferase DltB (MBOAT superfamily)
LLSTDPSFYACAAAIFVLFYAVRSPLLQTLVLTLGSLAMYATEGLFFLLLLLASSALTAVCSYFAASRAPRLAWVAMICGVVINLAVLGLFKYKQLLVPASAQPSSGLVRDFLALALPVGSASWSTLGATRKYFAIAIDSGATASTPGSTCPSSHSWWQVRSRRGRCSSPRSWRSG